jgi:hypothetical protein
MHIDPKSDVGGVSLVTIRHLFRHAGLDGSLSLPFVRETLKLNPTQAIGLLKALTDAGFIERAHPPHRASVLKLWQLTKEGIRLRGSTAAAPLHRETADRLLSELLHRIKLLNANEYFLARVRRAVVFGSYLGEASRIGDVDVAIECIRREEDYDKHYAANSRRVEEETWKGRSFSNMVERAFWWQREAMLFLRDRKRGLSLHDYASEQKIVDSGPHREIFSE